MTHCADTKSCWDTMARLIASLAKLMAPLHLQWKDTVSCLHSILCFKITDPGSRDRLNLRSHLTWDYPDDGFGTWKNWNIPDDAPDTLKGAALEYLFILLLAEFKQVEDSKGSSREASAHQDTPEVLRCALCHFMKYSPWADWDLTSSALQAFVDLVSTKSEELSGHVIESLVSTSFDHAQMSASDTLRSCWSGRACPEIRQKFHIKPSSEHISRAFILTHLRPRQSDLFLNR